MHISAEGTTSARVVLGREHHLSRAEERLAILARQGAALSATALAAGVLAVAGVEGALVVLGAAAAVGLVLALAALSARGARRDHALELIAAGRAALPVRAVREEAARLTAPRHVREVARSLEQVRRAARQPVLRRPLSPPLWAPGVVRAADAELGELVRTLRDGGPGAVALARAERLLSSPRSPLYGGDALRLREEVRRATFAG